MSTIPADDPSRGLKLLQADDPALPHVGVAGDTYTILVTGKDTAGRYCLIDMYVPPAGGPPPHRHDFEESFTVLEGEIEATFRGLKQTIRSGQVVNIPANAPHQFRNKSERAARLFVIVRRRVWKSFSSKSAFRLQRAPRRLRNPMQRPRRRSGLAQRPLRRNTEPSC